VLGQVKGAPHCFIVEDEEVLVELKVMDKLRVDVFLRVCERAEGPILALPQLIWVECAEFGLIFVRLLIIIVWL
jgi:hypothetical protein